ncbi:hypothetical protein C8F01DRAFT_1265411 [Mycena amicta]|nr:hypothetical protein C8F01DRAFT_1265411 [Mycena amicta]
MAHSGLIALAASRVVLPQASDVVVRRARPGQTGESVEYFTVAQEIQMCEWECYQTLRTAFVNAALAVLNDKDPGAPYAVIRQRYTLYIDPFEEPPKLANVYPAHKCGLCGSLASRPVLLWCNHLFCFVCIRLHLNKSWDCPDGSCRAQQRRPPWHRGELEKEIGEVYTGFADFTQVHYGWGDVRFPGTAVTASSSSNADELREKARERMAKLRARVAADETLATKAQERACEASASYRRRHAEEVSRRAKEKRERLWARRHGEDAYLARLIQERSGSSQ